jgi:hypothetical protein
MSCLSRQFYDILVYTKILFVYHLFTIKIVLRNVVEILFFLLTFYIFLNHFNVFMLKIIFKK